MNEPSATKLDEGLGNIKRGDVPVPNPDGLYKDEEEDLEKESDVTRLSLEKGRLTLENESLRQIIGLRKEYASKVFTFLVVWCVGVSMVLVFQGFPWFGFEVKESTINILVGSTTINVIGLVGIIVKGLFPKDLSANKKGN